jgi:hypothetical protein
MGRLVRIIEMEMNAMPDAVKLKSGQRRLWVLPMLPRLSFNLSEEHQHLLKEGGEEDREEEEEGKQQVRGMWQGTTQVDKQSGW